MSADIAATPEPSRAAGGDRTSLGRPGRTLVSILLALTAWTLASLVPSLGLTSPLALVRTLQELARGDLGPALAASAGRVVAGLCLGLVVGVPVGLAMGFSRSMDRLIGSLVHPLRQIPLFGWIPLLILALGLGEAPKLAFVALAVGYVMVLAAYEAARSVPHDLDEVTRLTGLSRIDRWRHLVVPSLLPALFSGLRIALILAWGAVFGAEILLANGRGLGSLVWGARELGRDDIVFAGTLILIAIGIGTSLAFAALERRVFWWREDRGGAAS